MKGVDAVGLGVQSTFECDFTGTKKGLFNLTGLSKRPGSLLQSLQRLLGTGKFTDTYRLVGGRVMDTFLINEGASSGRALLLLTMTNSTKRTRPTSLGLSTNTAWQTCGCSWFLSRCMQVLRISYF